MIRGINWCKAAFAVCAAGLAVARAARRGLSHLERLAQAGGALVLAVLVGIGEFAYRRDDGIYVIPIGTLGA